MPKRTVSLMLALCFAFLCGCNGTGSSATVSSDSPTVFFTDAVINELMADNASSLKDSSGRYSDWIELFNPTSFTVKLAGYGISDNPNQPYKYTLPDIELKKGEYLIIFMDGENRYTDGELHGSFKLSSAGDETVIFTNPNGKVLSTLAIPLCPADVSLGLVQDGSDSSGSYAFFTSPTPNGKNGGSYTFTLDSSADAKSDLPLLINEYMKNKNNLLLDSEGDYCAFAELYNPSDSEADLSGCYLSDSTEEPDKWQIPEGITIPAKGYLLIYLSGKDKVTENGELHASFKLSSSDTHLLLSDRLCRLADSVELISLTASLSYGRSPEDSNTWLYYTRPTPGKSNSTVGFADLSAGVAAPFGDTVYVSEVMSLNQSAHRNLAGEYLDWIELYNPTQNSIDLSGYYISDDLEEPNFFELPSGTEISAGGYLMLYASGMSGKSKKGDIYLPFSVSAEGETILLSTPDGITVDIFQTGRQRANMSSGRLTDSDGSRVFFTKATPSKANSELFSAGYTQAPEFSSDGGCMKTDFVTVSLTAENAEIYYTLDGTEPKIGSTRYTEPLLLDFNCVLRAVAVAEGRLVSDVASRTYVFGESHDLPVVCLSSDPEGLYSYESGIFADGPGYTDSYPHQGANYWKDWSRFSSFEYYTEDGNLGVTFNGEISVHGQYSRALDQKSIKFKLKAEYGKSEITYPFFRDYDVSTFKSFILRSGGQDYNSLKMRDAFFAQVIKGQMDLDYMEYRFCVLYINGEYNGLYCIREHTNADYIESHRGIDADNVDLLKGSSAVKAGDKTAYLELLNWMKKADLTLQENFNYAASKIDLDSWMNWWITETFFSNTDTGNIKFYCEKSEDGKWRWILYDLDWGMWKSTYFRNRLDKMLDPKGHGAGQMFSTVFARKLLSNEDFKNRFIEAYAHHLNTTFAPERTHAILDRMAAEIRTEMPRNYEKWRALKPASWEKNIVTMKEMLTERVELSKKHLQDTFDLSDERMKELFPDWEG